MILVFAAGMGAGYYLWSHPVIDTTVPPLVTESLETYIPEAADREMSELEGLIVVAENLLGQGDYTAALNVLLEADVAAVTASEQETVSNLLRQAVNARAAELLALGRTDDVDVMYESLTLNMPEQAEYYVLLAEHRIAMGNGELALPVLAQIENHHLLGGRARQLIGQINAPVEPEPLATIPLIKAGDQFLVEAQIDRNASAFLLLDTGASMTVVSPDLLIDLGYRLNGPQTRFSTAGGQVLAPVIDIGSLSLEGITVQPMTVGALEIGRPDDGVSGLLGMDFLRRFEFRIDQNGAFLILLDQRS